MTRDAGSARRLLVWDGPNMDLALSDVIGERASPATRPIMTEIYRWLVDRAGADDVEAAVFVTVPPGQETVMTPWIVSLRRAGFFVFMKPKMRRGDGVEADMLAHIEKRVSQKRTIEIIVAAHDPKHFEAPLRRLAKDKMSVQILGYRELDTIAADSPAIGFIDLEDLPGAFASSLPRTNLHDLPTAGRWLAPLEFPPSGEPVRTAQKSRSASRPAEPIDRTPQAETLDLTDSGRRDTVVDFVRGAAQRSNGLSLADVGDALREQYPEATLPELGFTSVGELLTAVTETGRIDLRRDDDGRHCLTTGELAEAPGQHPPNNSEQPSSDSASEEPISAAVGADTAPALDPKPATAESHNPIYAAFRAVSLDETAR